jgi:AcrR family transcriptional regulator
VSPRATADDRRAALLTAAFTTFLRYGFRKTSMDDIAREAEISRQALYGHFTDKETLFRAAMQSGLDAAMADVERVLADETAITTRLVRALDEWSGRYLGQLGQDGVDLGDGGRAVLGSMIADYGATFERKLARAIAGSPLAAACKGARVTPLQLAETLNACARGWKYKVKTRADFVARLDVAVRALVPRATTAK